MFIPIPQYANLNSHHISIDDEARLKKNRRSLQPEWRWHTEEVVYKTNSYGYRTVEPKDINWDNYFLSFGDSQVFGTGLNETDVYTSLLSNEIATQGINAGMPGSSPELIMYNLFNFLKKAPKHPKFVLIAWPNLVRRSWFLEDEVYFWLPQLSHLHKKYRKIDNISVELSEYSTHIATTWAYQELSIRMLCESLNIKYFGDFSFTPKSYYDCGIENELFDVYSLVPTPANTTDIDIINQYWARDYISKPHSSGAHAGPIYHRAIAHWLLNRL